MRPYRMHGVYWPALRWLWQAAAWLSIDWVIVVGLVACAVCVCVCTRLWALWQAYLPRHIVGHTSCHSVTIAAIPYSRTGCPHSLVVLQYSHCSHSAREGMLDLCEWAVLIDLGWVVSTVCRYAHGTWVGSVCVCECLIDVSAIY